MFHLFQLPTEYVPSSCCLVGTDSYSCQLDAGAPIEHSNHTESLAVVVSLFCVQLPPRT